MSTSIFISHSEKDKSLAEALVKLLVLGATANKNDIFCTSLEGLGIPKGKDFVDFIKENLQKPKLVIILLTPNYYESIFCLCELGASWILSHNIFPILVPPLDYDDVKAVLDGIECAKITDETDMNDLKDEVDNALGVKSKTAIWVKELKEFLGNLNGILQRLPKPTKIGIVQHEKLEQELKSKILELEIAAKRIKELKELNEKLIPCKDKEEAKRIVASVMDKWQAFQGIIADIRQKENILGNNNLVLDAVFHFIASQPFIIVRFNDDLREELREAIESGYVVFDENTNTVKLKESDPAIEEFLEYIYFLKDFLDKVDSEFMGVFIEKYKFNPDISNRRFWQALLSL